MGHSTRYRVWHELWKYVDISIESLYVFGGMFLDLWAEIALQAVGHEPKDFGRLIERFESPDPKETTALMPLWEAHKRQLLRFYYWHKPFRNELVTHKKRPWSHGTAVSTSGDVRLDRGINPGYFDSNSMAAKFEQLKALVSKLPPTHGIPLQDSYLHHLLLLCHETIEAFDQSDRRRLYELLKELGSYSAHPRQLTEELCGLAIDTTPQLLELVQARFDVAP